LRLLPVELLLDPRRAPLVLRPRLEASEVLEAVRLALPLVGKPYNTVRVYTFIAGLGVERYLGWRRVSGALLANSAKAWGTHDEVLICTDVILLRLMHASEAFRRAVDASDPPLDFHLLGSFSIEDIFKLHAQYPELLTEVQLPGLLGDTGGHALTTTATTATTTDALRSAFFHLRVPRSLRRLVDGLLIARNVMPARDWRLLLSAAWVLLVRVCLHRWARSASWMPSVALSSKL
jgi:hypothetical protein